MTPEIQDHMEITPFRAYPIYAGGRLLIGNVTKRTGMSAIISLGRESAMTPAAESQRAPSMNTPEM